VLTNPISLQIEVYIDHAICKVCGTCIDLCSMGVFVWDNGRVYPHKSDICIGCFKCSDFCPFNAIFPRWVLRA